jgi:hypothetical protein
LIQLDSWSAQAGLMKKSGRLKNRFLRVFVKGLWLRDDPWDWPLVIALAALEINHLYYMQKPRSAEFELP